jgi:SAM-dependent methyltransferase
MIINQFLEKFNSVLEGDRTDYVKPFIISWDYQENRRNRKKNYSNDLPSDFYSYSNPNEIVNWMNWFKGEYPSFYKNELIDPLFEKSKQNDIEILKILNVEYDFDKYRNVGLNNAHDFFIPQSYPVPEEFSINTVLDFGAGYGRQANLWWPFVKGRGNFFAVDAIPLSYCLQSQYYKSIKPDFKEYLESPTRFTIDTDSSDIYHIPTWRFDLIPDNSVDLVLCIQVLPELSAKLIIYIFKQFHRILKPGGAIYIRDLNYMYKTLGALNIDNSLIAQGFTLEYKAYIEHDRHLHGIPKVWRKNIETINSKQKASFSQKKRYLLSQIDSFIKNKLNRS